MNEQDWDIKKIKRLKIKHLVAYNLVMVLVAVLFGMFADHGGTTGVVLILCCIALWIQLIIILWSLRTGRVFGIKSERLVQKFERAYMGEKRWKRRKIGQAVLVLIINIGITAFIINFDVFRPMYMESPSDYFPLFAGWVGYNAGEITRIRKIKNESMI
ncbi:hypothetical protein [Thalassobacillus hwangdonensis]|uniref:DUF3278 domain-containing protein n=1 Tax=Thalassobacillus hwangdonensis TaxID=546108 RepID=A0ABW3L174_9BACI